MDFEGNATGTSIGGLPMQGAIEAIVLDLGVDA